MMPEGVARLGNQSVIHGNDGKGQALCAAVSGTAPIRLGQSARLGFDTGQAHLFRQDGPALARRIDLSGAVAV